VTEVSFHFNAPDKLEHACRLMRKALASGAKVVVTADSALLGRLDVALWSFSPLEFLPHCLQEASTPAMLAASPIVLSESARAAPHHHVLVNLGTCVPEGFERFERLIEIVTTDEDDRQHGRLRWKHYSDRGYAIRRENIAPNRKA
jgi:DNA polymerase III subunit chi